MRLALSFVRGTLLALGTILCVSLTGSVAVAAEPTLAADFDGDGLHDRVTLDRAEPSLLRVWLSATRTTSLIRSTAPFVGVAAVDLDGDRRAELIATDQRAGLQVWTSAHDGFQSFRPRLDLPDGLVPATRTGIDDDPECDGPSDSDVDICWPALELTASCHGPPSSTIASPRATSWTAPSVLPLMPRAPRPPPTSLL